ncbi:hypothetical protein SBRCBS47491_001191 [Sporothrix bragantina]|uniref:CCHC-type domain-containing protein n=1 Tax=Sporothrix bragantina TaxID=671064 RepID=A0ABP0AWH9_9PEZI
MVPSTTDDAATGSMAITDEQRKLKRYFPAVTPDAVFCIGCASYGHRVAACPLRSCRLCGSTGGDHTLFGCPAESSALVTAESLADRNQGDGRNKGKGKAKSKTATAPEANTAVPPQPSKCRYCLEDCIHTVVCPLLWRTFVHNPASKRSADKISTACYVCGLDDHFGGDCKDNTGEHISGRQYSRDDDIWSRKYALLFSDLTKTKPFPGFDAADGGNAPAAVAQPKREAKRVKTGRVDEAANPQASQASQAPQTAQPAQAAQAGVNAGGRGNNMGGKGNNMQAPNLPGAQAASSKQAEQAGTNAKSRKKRKANGQQQPASLNVALPNRPAAPKAAQSTPAAAEAINTRAAVAQAAQNASKAQKTAAPTQPQPKKTGGGPAQSRIPAHVQAQAQAQAQAKEKGKEAVPNRNNQPGQGQGGEAAGGKAKATRRRQNRTKQGGNVRAAEVVAGTTGGQGIGQANGETKSQARRRRNRGGPRNTVVSTT